LARAVANHGEPEAVALVRLEAKLRERDSELRAPALRVTLHRHLPDGVPTGVVVRVGEPVAVLLHAGRVHRELVGGAPVLVGVDQDADPVGRRVAVAARADADDL
jgi:hypothetical protein